MYSMNIKTVRYHLSVLLIVALLISLFSVSTANSAETEAPDSAARTAAENSYPFSDIADSYAAQEIRSLVQDGILSGYEDGTFKPRETMTRAHLAKVLVLALGLEEDGASADVFADVPANSWFKGYVGALLNTNITNGTSQTTFSPDSPVTREQLAVFFIRAFNLEALAVKLPFDASLSDVGQISDWARPHVSLAFKIGFLKGIDNGDGTLRFSPLDAADRQALARLAYEFKLNQALYKSKVQQLEAAIALAAAVKAANEAIAALPDASELTIDDKAAVEEARAKVEAARKLGATDKDFPNLSKLADAEQKIEELGRPRGGGIIGGGGGGGGGGIIRDTEPPVIISGSVKIGEASVPLVIGTNNEVTFNVDHALNNADMITDFTIVASSDTDKLIVTSSGVSRTVTFQNGTAHVSVAELLGPDFDRQGDGVSVGTLRRHLFEGNLELTGELTDKTGNKSTVKLKIVKPASAPVPEITSASAVIGGKAFSIHTNVPNYIAFIIDDALQDTDMFTSLTVAASSGADALTFSESGQSRTISFASGTQQTVKVATLLGPALDPQGDGVSVKKLRELLQNGNITVRGVLSDTNGKQSPVILTIIKGNNDSVPTLIGAAAVIDGNAEPAVITSGNTITFTLSKSLDDSQMLESLLIHASSNADTLAITEAGITKRIHFSNGTAQATIKELLGTAFDPQGDGVSVGKLRSALKSGNITVSGTLTNYTGVANNVTINVIVE